MWNSPAERRMFSRITINTRAMVCDLDCDGMPVDPKPCTLIDLSQGGAKVEVDADYHTSHVVVLTLRAYSGAEFHTLPCIVVWSQFCSSSRTYYGLKFIDLSDKVVGMLEYEIGHLMASGEGVL